MGIFFPAQFGRVLWGSHRKELSLDHRIIESYFEGTGIDLSVKDPILGVNHRMCFQDRFTFLVSGARFQNSSGFLWLDKFPVRESSYLLNQMGFPPLWARRQGRKSRLNKTHWFPVRRESFYHWLIETLPRIIRAREYFPELAVVTSQALHNYQYEFLDFLEIPCTRVSNRDLRKPFLAVLPTVDFAASGWPHPDDVARLKQLALSKGTEKEPRTKRIFLSRRNHSRYIENGTEVRELLIKNGFAEVFPESLTVQEQVRLFRGAEFIVAEHGGSLSNLVWCREGTIVVEIMRDDYSNFCFEIISRQNELKYRRLIAPEGRCDAGVLREILRN